MTDSSEHRLMRAAIVLTLALGSMACGESPTAPPVDPGPVMDGEYILRGTIVQGGVPLEDARIVAWYHTIDLTMPDWSCWFACDTRSGPAHGIQEIGRAESDAEGRYEMTLVGCGGANLSAFVDGGDEWVMVADTIFEYLCPMPSEIEVNVLVPEMTP